MGCGGSKGSAPTHQNGNANSRGWVPKKINPKDALGEPLDEQFIAGNGQILKYDVKTMTLTKVNVSVDPGDFDVNPWQILTLVDSC